MAVSCGSVSFYWLFTACIRVDLNKGLSTEKCHIFFSSSWERLNIMHLSYDIRMAALHFTGTGKCAVRSHCMVCLRSKERLSITTKEGMLCADCTCVFILKLWNQLTHINHVICFSNTFIKLHKTMILFIHFNLEQTFIFWSLWGPL